MATTRLSDIIEPSIFSAYTMQETVKRSALWQSGIIAEAPPEVAAVVQAGGATVDMPHWNDLDDGESNVGSDNPAQSATPDKIDTGADVAVQHFRNNGWEAANLVMQMAGEDPMTTIGDRVAAYWARQMQSTLIYSLNGVFADNDANDDDDMLVKIYNDVASPTDSNLIGNASVVAARLTAGDHMAEFTSMAMHSKPYGDLLKDDAISFIKPSESSIEIPTYQGLNVIVDDGLPVVAGTSSPQYTSYLFGAGAFGYAEGMPRIPTAVQDKPDGGNGEGVETLWSRKHFVLHPRGVKFTKSSVAGPSPTWTELANAANWDRVYDRKRVRLAAIQHN